MIAASDQSIVSPIASNDEAMQRTCLPIARTLAVGGAAPKCQTSRQLIRDNGAHSIHQMISQACDCDISVLEERLQIVRTGQLLELLGTAFKRTRKGLPWPVF